MLVKGANGIAIRNSLDKHVWLVGEHISKLAEPLGDNSHGDKHK